ncbi:hypothetical protein MMC09_000432 [Bachmanniomyces sp. S44760]|nr:hypothetical protein [Bachmanniomyces sp. S44760]
MAGSLKRIVKELTDLTTLPPPGLKITLPNDSDLHTWKITLSGPPPPSPYSGGTFTLLLLLPPDYPFKPPTLSFQTKIYHPNVSNDEKGSMCLGLLRADQWKPSSRVRDVLVFAQRVVEEPLPDEAVEEGIAREYREERKEWGIKARRWTRLYAMGAGAAEKEGKEKDGGKK